MYAALISKEPSCEVQQAYWIGQIASDLALSALSSVQSPAQTHSAQG